MTSGLEARGRFGKQDFVYFSEEDAYRCPAGEKLIYHYTNEEDGQQLRRYWTNARRDCALKASCTTGKERRITRWEHEHVLEEVQGRLDNNPMAMRQRRETVEHPFGTMKARMGATHFFTKTLPKVAAEMALSVLAYNLMRPQGDLCLQRRINFPSRLLHGSYQNGTASAPPKPLVQNPGSTSLYPISNTSPEHPNSEYFCTDPHDNASAKSTVIGLDGPALYWFGS
jgi:hypothetical protein